MAIKKANIIDPQVLGDFLDVKLVDAIKLTPVVMVDQTLVGKPGSKLELPKYNYVGDAEDVAEGEAMTPASLQASTDEVTIKKAGKYIEITDESKLSAYGDLVAEVGNQLLTSIASKIEKDLYAELRKATMEVQAQAFDKDVVADALVKFGEDLDGDKFLFINAKEFAVLRKDPDFVHVDNGIITGERGMIHGCRIVVADRVQDAEAFIMKRDALALVMKRNVMVEADRDITRGVDAYAVNEHYAVQLRYDDRVVKIKIGA